MHDWYDEILLNTACDKAILLSDFFKGARGDFHTFLYGAMFHRPDEETEKCGGQFIVLIY